MQTLILLQVLTNILITQDHIKLLKRLNWEWNRCEYGAPAVDPKRPYGNSDMDEDIAEILGWDFVEDRYGEQVITKEQSEKANALHYDLLGVIQQIISEYVDSHEA